MRDRHATAERPKSPAWTLLLLAVMALLATASCSDALTVAAPSPVPLVASRLTVIAGAGQSGEVRSTLPEVPAVRVTDASGTPVPKALVTFKPINSTIEASSALSDSSGIARAGRWTLGSTVGTQALDVELGAGTQGVRLTAEARFALPFSLSVLQFSPFGATSTDLAYVPDVYVRDRYGSAVPGVAIVFTPGPSGGTISAASPITDGTGRAAPARWTLGPDLGRYELTATAGGASAVMTATAVSHQPSEIKIVSGDAQRVPFGTVPLIVPTVRVTDAAGRPVPYHRVVWQASDAAGSDTGLTDGAGGAYYGQFRKTLSQVGNYSLTVRAGSASSTLTAAVLEAPSFIGFTSPAAGTTFEPNSQMPISVQVRLADGRPAVGYPVVFSEDIEVPGSSLGLPKNVTVATDAVGVSRYNRSAGPHPGSQTLLASVGALTTSLVVVDVGPLFPDVVVTGTSHSCAPSGSSVFCWGSNSVGQVGIGVTDGRRLAPAEVLAGQPRTLFADPRTLIAAGDRTCFEGIVDYVSYQRLPFCFGGASNGSVRSSTPIRNVGQFDVPGFDASKVDAVNGNRGIGVRVEGSTHACGLSYSTTAYCWGANASGQLGDGTTSDRTAPVAVGGGVKYFQIAVGGSHTCGLTPQLKTYCWGRNDSGQLGDGTTTSRATPVLVAGGMSFGNIAAGGAHTCGTVADGQLYCWGANGDGQLGIGSVGPAVTTPQLVPTVFRPRWISAGGAHTCIVAPTGGVFLFCWGRNADGQLGDGTTTNRSSPTPVAAFRP